MSPAPAFRCTLASLADDEAMAGTAPTNESFLLVEAPGPWGAQAVSDNRLPEAVRHHLAALPDVTVHLIRRPGARTGTARGETQVFLARRDETGFDVRTVVLPSPEALLDLDLSGEGEAWQAHTEPLWLVCTNGKRDLCCAELGRPVTAALADRWPEDTWEVTHLGGHRFSATLLALPSGLVLGRLTDATAVAACEAVLDGEVPVELCRGRAGRSGVDQVMELHVRAGGDPDVEVVAHPGPRRPQSCGDSPAKPTVRYEIRGAAG